MFKKILLIVLVIVVLLGIAIAVVLRIAPAYAKDYINKNGEELLGRKIALGNLDVSYYPLALNVDSLYILEQNSDSVFISLDSFQVQVDLNAALSSEYIVESALVSGLYVYVEQEGDRFNFNDIIERFSAEEDSLMEEEQPSEATEPIAYGIYNFLFKQGKLVFNDKNVGRVLQIENLHFALPEFSSYKQKSQSDLAFDFPKGGGIETNWDIDLDSGKYDVQFKIRDMHLNFLLPYLKQNLNLSDLNGLLNNETSISGSTVNMNEMLVQTTSSINDFYLKDQQGREFFAFDSLGVTVDSFKLGEQELQVSSFQLSGPSFYVERFTESTSLDGIVVENSNSNNAEVTDAEGDTLEDKPWRYSVEAIKVVGGKLKYADHTIPETFMYQVSNIKVNTQDIRHNSTTLKAEISLELPHKGVVNTQVNYNLVQANTFNADISAKRVKMTDFSPFSYHFIGSNIDEGRLSYTTQISADNGQLASDHALRLVEFDLGKKSNKDAEINMPVGLAIAILKDNEDNIDLEYDISGDMNDPDFNPKKLLWNTLGNIVIKTASTPGNLLGGAVGVDSAQIALLKFDPKETTLDSKVEKQLDAIGKLLTTKDELKAFVTVHGKDSTIAGEWAYADCLMEYYVQQNPKREGKLTGKDTLAALKIRKSDEFVLYLNPESLDIDDDQVLALYKRGIAEYEARLSSIYNERNQAILSYLKLESEVDTGQFDIVVGVESSGKQVDYQIRYDVRD